MIIDKLSKVVILEPSDSMNAETVSELHYS